MIHIAGRSQNDLIEVLVRNGAAFERFDQPAQAVEAAGDADGVVLLADGYPETVLEVTNDLFDTIENKRLRAFIEYPARIPDVAVAPPRSTAWERGVVSSEVFAPDLEAMRLLAIHGCRYIPMETDTPHIVIARVAGFDYAEFGLEDTETHPILFEHPSRSLLIATTKLSQMITARYAPTAAWHAIWRYILRWVDRDQDYSALQWTPAVRPTLGPETRLKPGVQIEAVRRGKVWFRKAKLYVHEAWAHEAERRLTGACNTDGPGNSESTGQPPDHGWPVGDGSLGCLEGPSSHIDFNGNQTFRYFLRNDCIGETAMAEAAAGAACQDESSRVIASNLLDYIYFNSNLAQGPRADPESPSYGLVRWHTIDGDGRYYGDDNARSMLGTMLTGALLASSRWDKPLLRCLLANLRTTGPNGFRNGALGEPALQEEGWLHFWNTERTNMAPHYESWLWACFLWAYHKTGFAPFLERARNGITATMNGYPDEWTWTNGMQQERARMLLSLAWLVRVQDNETHREWLRFMTGELLASQDECGAIREEVGSPGKGRYGPPKSNAAYGTAEAPLIQNNGDPLCDLLYTTNFAFVGLHEAAAVTGESLYRDAENRLADFLCRIQVRSETHPELDGAWFRAFDFKRWEYWASNADMDWGAWCVESGWTQGWITTVLALRQLNTSLWDVTAGSSVADHFEEYRTIMLPASAAS